MSPARRAHSSKRIAAACGVRMTGQTGTDGQTDGQTDARPLHIPCFAYYASSAITGWNQWRGPKSREQGKSNWAGSSQLPPYQLVVNIGEHCNLTYKGPSLRFGR